ISCANIGSQQNIYQKTKSVDLCLLCLSHNGVCGQKAIVISNTSSDDAGVITRFTRSLSESQIVDTRKRAAGEHREGCLDRRNNVSDPGFLVVPLIIEMDREQQFNELEIQQQSLLGPPPPPQVQLPK
ncbi:mitochondrial import receptor subunit TOM9-2-like, partial [Tripterygium wilfordii]|uniref:mitochondrial import receptor subunit TOM9-2-like n=1 Tax=Tripterygium wilfordii TaxID=458696 RepID=UPI0018F7EA06